MDKASYFPVFFIFLIVFVSCCVDQEKKVPGDNVSSFTLEEVTKTTLASQEAKDNSGGVDEISRMAESGRLDEALAQAGKNPSPRVLTYLNNAGVNYTRENRYEEADKIFAGILKIDSKQPDIWYNKGIVSAKLGRYEDAFLEYGKATDLKPDDSEAWYQKASMLYYLKRYDEAVDACNRSLVLEPHNPYAWYNLGIALTELKRYNESISAYDKALSVKPDYSEAENNKGNLLSDLGMYDEAIAAYDRALAIRYDEQTKKNRDIAETKANGTETPVSET